MNSTQALNAYRNVGAQSAVTDASPHQLILMLLDGALDRIATAKGAMERDDVAQQGEQVGRAISIVDSLRASLDHEQGGEIAENLSSLYEYMERRLVEARAGADIGMLDEVSGLLREIKGGWEAIPSEQRG